MSALYGVLLMLTVGLYTTSSLAAESTPSAPLATPEPTPTAVLNGQRTLPTSRNILAAQAVQLSLDAEQLIDLSTPAEHFSALFLAANTAQARGVVILLPEIGRASCRERV